MKQYQRKSDALVVSEKISFYNTIVFAINQIIRKLLYEHFFLQCTVEFRTNRFYLHLAKIDMCNFLGIPFADFIIRAPLALSTKRYWMKELKGYGLSYYTLCISNLIQGKFELNLSVFEINILIFQGKLNFSKTNKKMFEIA